MPRLRATTATPLAAAPSEARVVQIDPLADPRWDELVRSHPDARVYHLGAWSRILSRAYGFRSEYHALERAGQLCGVMPVMRTRGLLSGTRLRSLPVVNAAGPLAESDDDRRVLLEAVTGLAEDTAKVLTIRSRRADLGQLVSGLQMRHKQPSWVVSLPAQRELDLGALRKSSQHLYRNVTRARSRGVTFREGRSERDVKAFYRLYLEAMKKHRALPRRYRQIELSQELLDAQNAFRVFVVEHEGRILAACLCHPFRETVDLLYSGSDPRFLDLRPNHALWWGVLEWAAWNGYREVDLGDAWPGGPLARFKAQFLAKPVPEYRYDYVVDATAERLEAIRVASHRLDPSKGEQFSLHERLVGFAWAHAPAPVTRAAGALVYRLF